MEFPAGTRNRRWRRTWELRANPAARRHRGLTGLDTATPVPLPAQARPATIATAAAAVTSQAAAHTASASGQPQIVRRVSDGMAADVEPAATRPGTTGHGHCRSPASRRPGRAAARRGMHGHPAQLAADSGQAAQLTRHRFRAVSTPGAHCDSRARSRPATARNVRSAAGARIRPTPATPAAMAAGKDSTVTRPAPQWPGRPQGGPTHQARHGKRNQRRGGTRRCMADIAHVPTPARAACGRSPPGGSARSATATRSGNLAASPHPGLPA
jgi:hypothetical protein